MSKIEIKNVTKVFGNYNNQVKSLLKDNKSKDEILKETGSTVAVKNANFTIEDGEIFVVMGLSGSGKSTLIRLINRLIDPTDGDILIKSKNISSLNKKDLRNFRRENLSMVFQSFALFPFKTVVENVAFGLEIKNISKKKRLEKAEESLNLVGLGGYKDQLPKQLSGGMQQRVGLARALANDTDILLMDEAFSALDPLIRKEMQNELLQLQKNMQKTIIFITHDLDEALHIGDRIALMKDGEIAQVGTSEEIVINPANDYVKDFVKDIDRSKVLKVKHIMEPVDQVEVNDNMSFIDAESLLYKTFPHFKSGVRELWIKKDNTIVGKLNFQDVFETLADGNEVMNHA
ncbi:glycine betaine/L-proline ABC transporter ATP-binding protein [Mammaliicoccus sp. Dog046]|uniref:quaternary amine ABC transporter ATP-binding protein n=1 Tax=Mammaliicoccus sp. Dog046 TaxID=3034233 RepID=UPI002B258135|nr:glycine betaine/L-proline ABC transporter ATP-binding protein [Mammaliicoccus sp. Dog046]WQK85175.1 glycine betaine/L-proline ABC transporter ATP-binding protein [Mammaliicoccus sp. Dog046]